MMISYDSPTIEIRSPIVIGGEEIDCAIEIQCDVKLGVDDCGRVTAIEYERVEPVSIALAVAGVDLDLTAADSQKIVDRWRADEENAAFLARRVREEWSRDRRREWLAEQIYTLAEAAAVLGFSRETLAELLRKTAPTIGLRTAAGHVRLTSADLEIIRGLPRPKRGRPRKSDVKKRSNQTSTEATSGATKSKVQIDPTARHA